MALKSTIFKANLSIADMDRNYFAEHALTIARHPSENDERMMIRLLAFARFASELTTFGKGLSDPDTPDLFTPDLTGAIRHWIEVGQPDDRTLLRACGKADRVSVLAYATSTDLWWTGIAARLERARNLEVLAVANTESLQLAALADRTMSLHCSIQDGEAWVSDGPREAHLHLRVLRECDLREAR